MNIVSPQCRFDMQKQFKQTNQQKNLALEEEMLQETETTVL